jgi:hypothetical protein
MSEQGNEGENRFNAEAKAGKPPTRFYTANVRNGVVFSIEYSFDSQNIAEFMTHWIILLSQALKRPNLPSYKEIVQEPDFFISVPPEARQQLEETSLKIKELTGFTPLEIIQEEERLNMFMRHSETELPEGIKIFRLDKK